MEVILLQHMENLGRRGQVVKVRPGYARNYLLPRGVAAMATAGAKRRVEQESRKFKAQDDRARGDAEAIAARLGEIELSIPVKADEVNGGMRLGVPGRPAGEEFRVRASQALGGQDPQRPPEQLVAFVTEDPLGLAVGERYVAGEVHDDQGVRGEFKQPVGEHFARMRHVQTLAGMQRCHPRGNATLPL